MQKRPAYPRGYAPAAVIYTRSRWSRLKRVLCEVLRGAELLILGKAVSEGGMGYREGERGRERAQKRGRNRPKGKIREEIERSLRFSSLSSVSRPSPLGTLTASSSSRRRTNFSPRRDRSGRRTPLNSNAARFSLGRIKESIIRSTPPSYRSRSPFRG